jgi:hypothetical protein
MEQVGGIKSHLFLFFAVIAGYLLGLHGAGMWLKTGAAKAMTAAGGDGDLQGGKNQGGKT